MKVIRKLETLLSKTPQPRRQEGIAQDGLLQFVLPSQSASFDALQGVFSEFCSRHILVALRQKPARGAVECAYHVRLLDPSSHKAFLSELESLWDISRIRLEMRPVGTAVGRSNPADPGAQP
jgi:hypothetical protein